MKKFNRALFFAVILTGLAACKKESKMQAPISIVGTWDVQKLLSTDYKNGALQSVSVDTSFRSTIDFYQFYSDGTGKESLQDPSFPLTPFTYTISGSNFILSHQLDRVPNGKFTISKPSGIELIITDTYNYTLSADSYKEVEEMILVKQP